MEILTVTFKNGKELIITQEVANILRNRILQGDAGNFQIFTDIDEKVNMIINVSEVVCVE